MTLNLLGIGTCRAALAVVLLLAAQAVTDAQVRQVQTGNALDANPQIGSGGYNTVRPVTSGLNGNLIMSGNVTAGRSFQGFSPISNPSTLQTTIPSANLSNFIRDSVGLQSIQSGLSTYSPRPYFDPSQTAITTGAIESLSLLPRDLNGSYRASQYQYQLPVAPLSSIQRIGQALPTGLPYAAPGWEPAGIGMFNPELLATSPGQISRNPLTPYSVRTRLEGTESGRDTTQAGQQVDPGERLAQPGTLRLPDLGTLPDAQPAQPNETTPETAGQPQIAQITRSLRPNTGRQPTGGPMNQPAQQAADQTGSSLLTQMQRYSGAQQSAVSGTEPQQQPQGKPLTQPQQQPLDLSVATAGQRPTDEIRLIKPGATPLQREQLRADIGREQASRLVEQRLRMPIRSLAGARQTQADQLLAQAEDLMRKGDYYRASETYNGVITAAPDNALAWLGRANALLAAGEYLRAYVALDRGISRFPQILQFDYDLPALIGNKDILDVRRAELEKILAANPDHRLRFLLGYLEYYSGPRDVGLQTIQQAAQAAPADTTIGQAYQILKQRSAASQPARP